MKRLGFHVDAFGDIRQVNYMVTGADPVDSDEGPMSPTRAQVIWHYDVWAHTDVWGVLLPRQEIEVCVRFNADLATAQQTGYGDIATAPEWLWQLSSDRKPLHLTRDELVMTTAVLVHGVQALPEVMRSVEGLEAARTALRKLNEALGRS